MTPSPLLDNLIYDTPRGRGEQGRSSSVCWADRYQRFPETPERFDRELCVLGCEGFTTGWHWWEVTVQEADDIPAWVKACWAIGVAKESVRRKGSFQMSPKVGIWAMGRSGGESYAFSMVWQPLSLQSRLRRLQVRLDYEAGKVEFLDMETDISLYTFWTGPLLGEMLRPFFYLGKEGVTLQCEEFPRPIKDLRD
uniref:B30.2/SPRY domain-containing protein n=1 Tax=Naja naja TaxID=35670 RepID=A0A8C6VF25_NAJNA